MGVCLFFIFCFLCGLKQVVDCAPCVDDSTKGSPSPGSDANAGPDPAYVMHMVYENTDPAYQLDCCGVIKNVEFKTDPGGTIYFQTWTPGTGTSYSLFSHTELTVAAAGLHVVPVNVAIQPGDKYGWMASAVGANILKHKAAGASSPEVVDRFTTTMVSTVGQSLDWGTADQVAESYSPALKLYLGPGNLPSLTSSNGLTITMNTADAVGKVITVLTAADNDLTDTLTTTMPVANADYTLTTTTAKTSTLTLANSLAGISRTETLSFLVVDPCGNNSTLTLTLNIVNDPPTVSLPRSDVLFEDTTTKTLLRTLVVTDTVDVVSCYLAASNDPTYPFEVSVVPGTTDLGIYSTANPNYSYATKNFYEVLIECTDGDPANIIQKNYYLYLLKNSPPVVTNLPQQITIPATTSTGTVYTVAATDPEGDAIEYKLTCPKNPSCPFIIQPFTGQVQLTADLTTSTTTGYDLYISVNDTRNTVDPVVLTVLVSGINDPVVIQNLPLTANYPVNENTAILTPIFTVTSADQDTSQTLTYSMTSTGSGLTYFTIDAITGVISTGLTTANYETLGSKTFTFSVSVTDGVATDTQPLVVDIIDINEAPVYSQTSFSISTNEAVGGTSLGIPALGVVDPDSGDSRTHDLNCGNGDFYMNSNTGEIKFQSDYDLDAGMASTVTCTLMVTDNGGLTDTALLLISVANANDNTPTFNPSQYTFFLNYYAAVGTVVGSISATDGDIGVYGNLYYALDQTNQADEYFAVDANGQITLTKSLATLGPGTSLTITGVAFDGGSLQDTAPIRIIISELTTLAPTTTTQRYRKFAEDSRNMPWLVLSLLSFAILFGMTAWVVYTCKGKNSLAETIKACRRRPIRPRLWQRRIRQPPPPQPVYQDITIRKPPPPKEVKQWKGGREGCPPGTYSGVETSYI